MPKKVKKGPLDLNIAIGKVGHTEKAVLAKNLAVMLKSGLTIAEAVEISADQASGRLKSVLKGVYSSIQAGQTLSASLGRYPKIFSGLFINATKAGEASGTLEENLGNIAEQLKKEKELRSKIKGAMFYPIVVFVAAFFLGLAMAFLVLPKITPLFEGLKIELPFTTRALIWASHIIRDQGTWIFIGTIAVVIFFWWLLKRKFSKPAIHWVLLRLPIVGKITRHTNLSRFASTLGTLLKSGLNIDEALDITASTLNNYYYGKSLSTVVKRVTKGTGLSTALKRYPKLYSKMTVRMIKVGEKSGNLEDTLFYLSDFYETEVDTSTKSLATAIEPMLLIFIGLVVAFLALSIITPIYQITGNVRR
jgi:type II secretory pathway component PulF